MSRAAKIATGVAAAAIVAGLVALAYPAFAALGEFEHPATSAATATHRTAAPDPTPSPSPSQDSGSSDCVNEASISITGKHGDSPTARLAYASSLTDAGARPGA
ncbi:MAG: hypothetical protein JST33_17075, partial [Actinobacteria bacterium]|nr:hypothetical protein [Actinomycetota bacterium]